MLPGIPPRKRRQKRLKARNVRSSARRNLSFWRPQIRHIIRPCGASLQLRRSWYWQRQCRLRRSTVVAVMRRVVGMADSPRTAALAADTPSAACTLARASRRTDHPLSIHLSLPVDSTHAASTVSMDGDSATTASETIATGMAAATDIPTTVGESIPTGDGMARPMIRIRKNKPVWRMR